MSEYIGASFMNTPNVLSGRGSASTKKLEGTSDGAGVSVPSKMCTAMLMFLGTWYLLLRESLGREQSLR